jgi:hypothetical protein
VGGLQTSAKIINSRGYGYTYSVTLLNGKTYRLLRIESLLHVNEMTGVCIVLEWPGLKTGIGRLLPVVPAFNLPEALPTKPHHLSPVGGMCTLI